MTALKLPLPPDCKPNLQYTEAGNKYQIRSRYFLRGAFYDRNIKIAKGDIPEGWHELSTAEKYMKYAQERVNLAMERFAERDAKREAFLHMTEDDDLPVWDCAG